jgi:hypothetical protein
MQSMFACSSRKLTLKKREKSNYLWIKLCNTLLIHGRMEPLVRGANACAPAFRDAESAGIGQGDSFDRGIVCAEVGSDFLYERTTRGRSRSWLA